MPERGVTRLVIEFQRGVELDPQSCAWWASTGTAGDALPLKDARFVAMGEGFGAGGGLPSANPARPLEGPLRTSDAWRACRGFAVGLPGDARSRPWRQDPAPSASVAPVKRMWCWMCRGRWPLPAPQGVVVKMTRSSDTTVDLPPGRAYPIVGALDAFVSIHANAISMRRPEVNGLETFYFQSFQGKNSPP